MSRTPRFLSVIATAAFAWMFSAGVPAQTTGPDEKELAAYRLTLPTVRKVAAVMKAFADEAEQDPRAKEMAKIKAEIEELGKKDELTEAEQAKMDKLQERRQALEEEAANSPDRDGTNAKTLDEMEAQVRKHPAALRALASQGLTPREYAKATMALLIASMVEGFSQGKADLAKLPPGVNPENVKFVRENKTELETIYAAMSGKDKK